MLQVGDRLGAFQVEGCLGWGGMGEVWRATDSKLGREVALKLLPDDFAADPGRHARFEREARTLASLNHPNIATLYGLEHLDGRHTLVMELVEGEDLSERIERGRVPLEETIPIALQIAEALEAAHEAGIVHRDLKPANIKLRPDGTVKVLDFGLAKAWEADGGDSSLSMSPTMTRHATVEGVILGTAAYMSPEQAAGKGADRRADIWAFGVVVWEMLNGRNLFDGETVSHVLASVLKDEIDLHELPPETPQKLRELIGRCLRKKAKHRLQAIGDARIVLEEVRADPNSGAGLPARVDGEVVRPSLARQALPWVTAVVAAGAAAVLLWLNLTGEPDRVLRASISPPPNTVFHLATVDPGPPALSPDGTRLAYSVRDEDGVVRLYLRGLDQPEAHVVPGSEGAQFPFWSPDSKRVAFFTQADGFLKKADAAGGPPVSICSVQNAKGGSWGAGGTIVFTPKPGTALQRVSSAGGVPQDVTEIDRNRHNSHRHPRFLPDGRRFLYLARGRKAAESAVMVGSLDGENDRELMRNGSQAEYAAGHLFFVRGQTLMAQPIDLETLEFTGEAVPVAEKTLTIPPAALALFSVSPAGILAYNAGTVQDEVTPRWYDRSGVEIGSLGEPGQYYTVALAPDNRNAALTVTSRAGGSIEIWTYDLERKLRTRFTFDNATDYLPVWSPDGRNIAFASDRSGSTNIYRMSVGGVRGAELLVESDRNLTPRGWSPDGEWLLYAKDAEETGNDIWAVRVDGTSEPRELRAESGIDIPGSVSRDGRWLSFSSNESGQSEVYVTPFPDAGRRWQASTDSGVFPFWCADGRELVYQRLDGRLMSVEVELGADSVRFGNTTEWFDTSPPTEFGPAFAPSADCRRVLVVPRGSGSENTSLSIMVGWPEVLENR